MKCECCGKRKGLLESFATIESLDGKANVCVDCNDLLYKLRDAANEGDPECYNESKRALQKRKRKPSERFNKWLKDYVVLQEQAIKLVNGEDKRS